MGKRVGKTPLPLPVTERVSETLLRLPFYNTLTQTDQEEVISAIHEFFGGGGA